MAKNFIHLGELLKRVDGQNIFLWHLIHQWDAVSLGPQNARNVSQVILPTSVIWAESLEGSKQGFSIEAVIAGVDFRNTQLMFRRVFLLHNGGKLTV